MSNIISTRFANKQTVAVGRLHPLIILCIVVHTKEASSSEIIKNPSCCFQYQILIVAIIRIQLKSFSAATPEAPFLALPASSLRPPRPHRLSIFQFNFHRPQGNDEPKIDIILTLTVKTGTKPPVTLNSHISRMGRIGVSNWVHCIQWRQTFSNPSQLRAARRREDWGVLEWLLMGMKNR